MNTVALPIEQQVNGVRGHDLHAVDQRVRRHLFADRDLRDRHRPQLRAGAGAEPRLRRRWRSLPQSVQVQGVTVQQKSTSILQIVTLTSPDGRYDSLFLSNYATISLVPELSRVPGVGNVGVFGVGQYSMRIWLDPQTLQARGLAPQDVIKAIQQQSQQVTSGQVGAPPAPAGQNFQYTVNVEGRLIDPAEFANIIVKIDSANGGQITRVKDVGRVELGAQTYSQSSRLNGKPAAGIAIYQLPTANALNVATRVNARMAELAKAFPQDLTYVVPFDTTRFVTASINEVYKTLLEAARAGADRDPGVPAGLASHAGAGDHRPGDHHRRLRRDGGARLHREPVHAVRDHPGHRHRGGRRDRDRGGRRAPYRARPDAARRVDQGDGRAVRADHRHHAGADVGVHAGRLPAGPDRPDVRPVRPGDRGDRADQRDQRRDAEADAVRAVAAHAGAAGEAQLLLPRLQPRLSAGREWLCPADRRHGAPQRRDGDRRPGRCGSRRLGHRASADLVHSHRGPGLRAGRDAASRRRRRSGARSR